ncbi:hypothetical protein JXI42_05915 [bacterium]|nr:hypothetical protein [bacterium]
MNRNNYLLIVLVFLLLVVGSLYCDGSEKSAKPAVITGETSTERVKYLCAAYFGSIGCHNCEDVATVVAKELFDKYPNMVLILYELEEHPDNAGVIGKYNSQYRAGFMVPIVIFNKDLNGAGGKTLQNDVKEMADELKCNNCPLVDGQVPFQEVDITALPGQPQIWMKDRILINEEGGDEVSNKHLHNLLTVNNIDNYVNKMGYTSSVPQHHQIVENIAYGKAVRIGCWLFQWEPYFKDKD